MNTFLSTSTFPYLNVHSHITSDDRYNKTIKNGIWMYMLLLIFEGALRKWFLPSLAGPILILRDPLTLWILYLAWKKGQLNLNLFVLTMLMIGFLSIYTAYFLGHGNLYVALYGARIYILHLPLIFVIGKVMSANDIQKIGKFIVLITIPMTVLIIAQFYSPQSAWINRSVGGESGGGFSGALNFFRPPGTFSFTNGNTLFYSLSACFIISFWFKIKHINRIVLMAASVSLLLAIPYSISRGLMFQVIISLLFAIVYSLSKPKYLKGVIVATAVLITCIFLLSFTSYFTTATEVFTSRFENANRVEGGLNGVLLDRFLGGLIGAIKLSSQQPFFGYGLGMGTNVGAMILSGGRFFLISEGEWGRIIGEIGPIFGLIIIFFRLKLAFNLFINSLLKLKDDIILPWLLTSFAALSIAQAGWAQPTSLGFCVLLTGFTLASLKAKPNP